MKKFRANTLISALVLALFTALILPVMAFAKPSDSLYEYVYNVFGKLQQNWEQQTYANRLSNSLLTFTLTEDGRLLNSSVEKMTTDSVSGDEVLSFLKTSAPFGRFPEHLQGSQLSFTFKFTPDSLQMVGYQVLDKKQKAVLTSPINYSADYPNLNDEPIAAAAVWENPGAPTADEQVMQNYVADVQSQIGGKWQLPENVTFEQRAVAMVLIDKNGNLLGTHLTQSSGNKTVDKAAMNAIYQAGPFAPVPASFHTLPLQIEYVFDPLTANE